MTDLQASIYDRCNIQKMQIQPEVSITAKSPISNNTPWGKLFFYERDICQNIDCKYL